MQRADFRKVKRMRWLRSAATAIVLSCFPFTACHAALYKCEQANGNIAYQETPCADNTQAQPVQITPAQPEAPPPSSDENVNQAPPVNTLTPGIPPETQETPAPVAINGASGDGASANDTAVNQTGGYQNKIWTLGPFAVPLAILIMVLIGRMAHRRGRSVANWIVFSFLTTPFFAAILLLLLGDAE